MQEFSLLRQCGAAYRTRVRYYLCVRERLVYALKSLVSRVRVAVLLCNGALVPSLPGAQCLYPALDVEPRGDQRGKIRVVQRVVRRQVLR